MNTYGRFPDGGTSLAMFGRPTIAMANRICTNTSLEVTKHVVDGIEYPMKNPTHREIEAITYYNISGQQISNLEGEHIVIQYILYKDGTSTSRKISVP